MNRVRLAVAGLALAAAVSGTAGVAYAQNPVLDILDPEQTLIDICLATSIDDVDNLLAGLTEEDLVQGLAPLLDLTVPEQDELTLDVDLTTLRDRLDCTDVVSPTTTPAPTTTTAPPVTEEPEPTITRESQADDEDDDAGSVRRAPRGGVDTGAGPE